MSAHSSIRRSPGIFVAGAVIALMQAPQALAEDLIRVGMVPDTGATAASLEEKKPLQAYLSEALGVPVKLVIPRDYNATIDGLGNGAFDFATFGAVSYVKAHEKYGVVPLVHRDIDKQFHALFITQADSPIKSISDLKGKRFAFGDILSTSGHVIPYRTMVETGLDPKQDLQWFRYTGSHTATVQAVATGIADAGATDEAIYKALIDDGKVDASKLRVFYTTPPFVDYVWAARKDVSAATQKRFADAFFRLVPGTDDIVLGILRGQHFVTATNAEYQSILEMMKKLSLL
jgi:phosphonate transport system substrate-binding protein